MNIYQYMPDLRSSESSRSGNQRSKNILERWVYITKKKKKAKWKHDSAPEDC